jgi:hypothetical protein
MTTVRIKKDAAAIVYNSVTGMHEPLIPGTAFEDDHPLVREFPWAFESDIEQATAAPGEKRSTRTRTK